MPIKNRRLILLLILLFLLIIVGASKLPIAVERKITVFKPEVKKINGNDLLIDVNKNNCLPSNLITLCRKCHARIHKRIEYGPK